MTDQALPGWSKFVLAGTAGTSGWMFIHPFDVLKVRMQLVGEQAMLQGTPRPGTLSVAKDIIKTEGMQGMYRGLSAAVMRQLTYTSLRIGLYDSFKEQIGADTGIKRAASGLLAGGITAFVCNPVDLSLVRMQADGRRPLAERRNYTHIFNALYRIPKEEGILTFWRGATPTVARAMVVSSTQLATYDTAKSFFADSGLSFVSEGVGNHFAGSLTSAVVYCLASLPLDTAKTRMQEQTKVDGKLVYKNVLQTLYRIGSNEGVLSLWNGFGAYFARGGGHTIALFLFLEQYRSLFSKYYPRNNL